MGGKKLIGKFGVAPSRLQTDFVTIAKFNRYRLTIVPLPDWKWGINRGKREQGEKFEDRSINIENNPYPTATVPTLFATTDSRYPFRFFLYLLSTVRRFDTSARFKLRKTSKLII